MELLKLKKKDVFIVESHNQVLEAWASGGDQNVFSLDYHTDTRRAFQNYSYWRADSEIKAGQPYSHEQRTKELTDHKINQYLENEITIQQINDNLKHDEHLDFSVRTDIIDTVFILSTNSNVTSSNPNVHIVDGTTEYQGQRIIEYSPSCIPGCEKDIHDEECRISRAESSIEDTFLEDAVLQAEIISSSFFNRYILDIDCDYFNTEESLYPGEYETFKNLIREAEFITIALESECVKICRHDGSHLDSETILTRLITLIEEV